MKWWPVFTLVSSLRIQIPQKIYDNGNEDDEKFKILSLNHELSWIRGLENWDNMKIIKNSYRIHNNLKLIRRGNWAGMQHASRLSGVG